METTTIDHDIRVFYVTAKSFPEGIAEALQNLHALVPPSNDRNYYGISRPENGKIVYRAAAEEIEHGEAGKLKCDTLVLKKGQYIGETIHDYMKDLRGIQRFFKKILDRPDLDPKGYCVEWYLSDRDVKCMVRLQS